MPSILLKTVGKMGPKTAEIKNKIGIIFQNTSCDYHPNAEIMLRSIAFPLFFGGTHDRRALINN